MFDITIGIHQNAPCPENEQPHRSSLDEPEEMTSRLGDLLFHSPAIHPDSVGSPKGMFPSIMNVLALSAVLAEEARLASSVCGEDLPRLCCGCTLTTTNYSPSTSTCSTCRADCSSDLVCRVLKPWALPDGNASDHFFADLSVREETAMTGEISLEIGSSTYSTGIGVC